MSEVSMTASASGALPGVATIADVLQAQTALAGEAREKRPSKLGSTRKEARFILSRMAEPEKPGVISCLNGCLKVGTGRDDWNIKSSPVAWAQAGVLLEQAHQAVGERFASLVDQAIATESPQVLVNS